MTEFERMTLDGTGWRVMVLGDQPSEPDIATTIRFEDGHAGGRGGVNRYHGSYEVRAVGDTVELALGAVATTRMAGPEPAMRQEARWFALLGQPAAIERAGTGLVLLHPDGTRSRLEPDHPADGASPA